MAAGPWKHALPRATSRRVSLTFRKVGTATRERFQAIREASSEAQEARRVRRLAAKEARGRRPKEDGQPALNFREIEQGCSPAPCVPWVGAALEWKWRMRGQILGGRHNQ